MLTGEFFKDNKENAAKLKSANACNVREYANEVLREFE
jgi:hypothetical protein